MHFIVDPATFRCNSVSMESHPRWPLILAFRLSAVARGFATIIVFRGCEFVKSAHLQPLSCVSKQCCDIDYNNLRFVLESMDHKFWGMWRNISRNTFSTFSVDPTVSSSRRNTISFFGDRTLMEYLVKIRQLILRIVIAVLIPLRVSSSGDVYFVNIKMSELQ